MPKQTRAIVTALLALLVGCESKPPEPKPEAPAAPTTTSGAETVKTPHGANPHRGPHGATPDTTAPGDLGWTKPDAWEQVEHPSPMRKATFKIPKVEGDSEDAEMSVTQVGGAIEANIDRWEGQFEGSPQAKTEKKKVGDFEVTVVTIDGTYKGGGPMMGGSGEPEQDWALLAAIVDTEPAHFFKMTGPKKTVQAARGDFDALVASFAKK